MRHIIQHFEEHDITELSGLVIDNIVIDNDNLLRLEQVRELMTQLLRNPFTQRRRYLHNGVLNLLKCLLVVVLEVVQNGLCRTARTRTWISAAI